jgi:hypothetical protein
MNIKFNCNTQFYDEGELITVKHGDTKQVGDKIGTILLTCKHGVQVSPEADAEETDTQSDPE